MSRYTLLNADSIQAKAGTGGGAINYTISSGDEITSGTEVFKILAQGQLTTSVASLYSPGGATKTSIIQMVLFANTTASDVDNCFVYVNGTATGNQETGRFKIPAYGTAILNKDGLRVLDGSGGLVSSVNLSNSTPQALGVAASGTGTQASRDDHVHVMPRLDQVSNPTASVSLNSQMITDLAPGVSANDAVNKNQLDNAVAGLEHKASCDYATVAALPAIIYNNGSSGVGATLTGASVGALSVDGSSPVVGNRILVKNQVTTAYNGIYRVTATGSGIAVFVLTRTTDFDGSGDVIDDGDTTFVTGGATLDSTTWTVDSGTVATVGTDPITFAQTAGPGALVGGTGIVITGNTIDAQVDASTLEIVGDQIREKDGGTTNAKLANMTQATFKMRAAAAGTGVPIDGTAIQAKTALAIANTDVSGLGTLSTQNGTFSGTSSGTNTGDQTATTVPSSATGDVAATNVQAAIAELASEKVPVTRTLTTTTPIQIDASTSADLSSNRTLSIIPASTTLAGSESAANFLRITSQPRNLMSDIPGGTNVKADGLYLLDATMTSGTSTINSASATFTVADVGKICGMNGAGIGGATLYGSITTRNSATQIVVTFQASTTVAANGVFIYGTDDLTAYNAAMADGGRWIWPDIQEVNNRATRMLFSNAPTIINSTNTQLLASGGITNFDVGFNERGCFMHIMRSNNPNTGSATLGVTQLIGCAVELAPTTGASNQALKGMRFEGFTIECAGNVPMGLRAISCHKGYFSDIHIKNPAYRAYDFTTVGGQLGEATDYSKNLHERLSARCLDGVSTSTTAAGAVANLFANANLVLTNAAGGGFSSSGGLGVAMTTIGGQERPTLFQYTGISTNTLTGITCLFTVAGVSAALANLGVVEPASPFFADGFVEDGNPNSQNAGAGNAPGNTSLNHFYDCSVVHANGVARRYLNADSNKCIGFSVNRSVGGTGKGCTYWGAASAINTARNNLDLGGDPGAGGAIVYGQEMTSVTANPLANRWYDYELGNGAPRPVSGTGAAVTTSDFMVTYNGALVPALMNRGQGGVTGNAATVGGAGGAGVTGVLPGMFIVMPPQGPAVGTSGEFLVGLGKGGAGTSVQLGMNYGVANTAADASTGVGTAWTGTAIADEMWGLITWSFTAIGGSATIVARWIPLRRQTDAALTGWVTTVAAYKALHTYTSVAFNSALANPGPAYLSLQVRANTGTVVSVLPGSVAKVNVA